MKHFWLDDAQQLIMDAATSTAPQYGFVGLLKSSKPWKRACIEALGEQLPETDYLNVYETTRLRGSSVLPNKMFRLNGKQAMAFRLKFGGTDEGTLLRDPTGESWGNMQICKDGIGCSFKSVDALQREWARPAQFHKHEAKQALVWAWLGRPFGPTLETVGDHCNGLPLSWAQPLVWINAALWHSASNPMPVPEQTTLFNQIFTIERGAFSEAPEYVGQSWAREWWNKMQNVYYRKLYGVRDVLHDTIL